MALQGALEDKGMLTRLQTALKIEAIAEPYIKEERYVTLKEIVILEPELETHFTTDTAAVLWCRNSCRRNLKGTRVDGVYDSDPEKNADATKFDFISLTT
jgi:uridylate kinase